MIDMHIGRLWAGTEESLQSLLTAAAAQEKQAFFDDDEEDDGSTPSRLVQRVGDVGVLHVQGSLVNRDSWLNQLFGLTSYNEIRKGLVELATDDSVKTILMSLDTPGGAVSGLSDVSDLVAGIDANVKPVLAHTSGMMASAGYHIGSSARHISAGKMADVGSIGVLQVHREATKLEERMGITTTVVRAGEFKALGNPYEPLSEKAKQEIQASCDYSYSLFVGHVAEHRGVSPEQVKLQMAEGRVFTGEQARAVNLIDEVCTFDEALQYAAEIAREGVAKTESLPQYGSSMKGLTPMKKATLNPITAAAQALATQAASQAAAATAAPPPEVVVVTPAAGEGEEQEATETGAETQASTEMKIAEPTALAVVQGQLAQAQEQLLDAKVELRDVQKKLEANAETNKGMRAVVEQSVQYLRVALGQPAAEASGLSDSQLLAEQKRLQDQFDANFQAGGVASVSVGSDNEQETPVTARTLRVKAASLSKRK